MKVFVMKLKDKNIFQSMSRRGDCLDNSPIENFFILMKQEMHYGEIYRSFKELNNSINKYIYYYNNKIIKVKLTGMSPVEYRNYTSQLAALIFNLTFEDQYIIPCTSTLYHWIVHGFLKTKNVDSLEKIL